MLTCDVVVQPVLACAEVGNSKIEVLLNNLSYFFLNSCLRSCLDFEEKLEKYASDGVFSGDDIPNVDIIYSIQNMTSCDQ